MANSSLVEKIVSLLHQQNVDEVDELLSTLETVVLKSSSQIVENLLLELSDNITFFSGTALTRVLRVLFVGNRPINEVHLHRIASKDPSVKNRTYAEALLYRQTAPVKEPVFFLVTKDIALAANFISITPFGYSLSIPHQSDFKQKIDNVRRKTLVIDGLTMRSREYDDIFWILANNEWEILPEPDPYRIRSKVRVENTFDEVVLLHDGSQYTEKKSKQLIRMSPEIKIVSRYSLEAISLVLEEIELKKEILLV